MGDLFIGTKIEKTAALYTSLGGTFLIDPKTLAQKLKKVSCFVFDWDGVFNDGRKGAEKTSDFAEPDSMATHILRYTYWRIHGKMPIIAIITGQHNESAVRFAERENLQYVFEGFKNKAEPLKILATECKLQKEHIATMFDDIIDYPLAINSEVRFMVQRKESPLFTDYFVNHKLADYITFSTNNGYKVREVAELIIGLTGTYDDMLVSRFDDPERYNTFWDLRTSSKTKVVKFAKK